MQLLQSRPNKRRPRKWKLILSVLVIVLGVGAWAAKDPLLLRYRSWKQDRALAQARDFIANRDAPNAQLALEVALRAGPGNPDTIRVAADMLEQVGAPQAMRLRRAVVQINPESAEDAAKLVLCCLRFRDYNAAKDALSGTPHALSIQPPMMHAALAYALATSNAPVADALLKELQTKFPESPDLKHAHALLRLRHPRADEREAAKAELHELGRSTPALELQIARELIGDALQRQDYAAAKSRLLAFVQRPEATLDDRLQLANIELVQEQMPFEPIFARVAPIAARSEQEAAQFIQWLLVQNRADDADRWLSELPTALRGSPTLMSAQADIAAQQKDWDRLAFVLRTGAWGFVPNDTVRLAFAAKTVDSPNRPSLKRETWEMALSSAGGNLVTLRVLQRLSSLWQWPEESERTLWAIARGFPDQTWAHQALFNIFRERKDTTSMRDVMNTLREADGSVRRYQHDWALLTLLVQPNSNWNPAKDTMRQLHELDPSDAIYTTGYAFALAQSGKAAEALATIEKLTPEQRDYPPRQPYLAFIYGVARKGSELERTTTLTAGTNYLPEENYLFTRAREELNRKPEKPKTVATGATEEAKPTIAKP